MAVVGNAAERPAARTSSENKEGVRTYERTFVVITDDAQDGAVTVRAANGLPALYFGYQTDNEIDLAAICIGRKPRQIDRFVWEVVISYSSASDRINQEAPENEDPFDNQPIITFSFETYQTPLIGEPNDDKVSRAIIGAGFGKAVLNSAGEPFDPPPLKDESRPILTITINLPSFDVIETIIYQDAVNSDPFFGAFPRELKMMGISTNGRQKRTVNGLDIFFFPVVYTMAYNSFTWDIQVLDKGTYFVKDSLKVPFENNGVPYIGLLNGAGAKNPDGADAQYLTFRAYSEQPFANLAAPRGLPQDINAFVEE